VKNAVKRVVTNSIAIVQRLPEISPAIIDVTLQTYAEAPNGYPNRTGPLMGGNAIRFAQLIAPQFKTFDLQLDAGEYTLDTTGVFPNITTLSIRSDGNGRGLIGDHHTIGAENFPNLQHLTSIGDQSIDIGHFELMPESLQSISVILDEISSDIQLLPDATHTVAFGWSSADMVDFNDYTLGDISDVYDYRLMAGVRKLKLMGTVCPPLNRLPAQLTHLILDEDILDFNRRPDTGLAHLPATLQYLKIDADASPDPNLNALPVGLKTLIVADESYNAPIDHLPPGLTELEIRSHEFEQPLDALPASLELLSIGVSLTLDCRRLLRLQRLSVHSVRPHSRVILTPSIREIKSNGLIKFTFI
jgi:hypothetical protein